MLAGRPRGISPPRSPTSVPSPTLRHHPAPLVSSFLLFVAVLAIASSSPVHASPQLGSPSVTTALTINAPVERPPRGTPALDPVSLAAAAFGLILGILLLFRGYRLPPRITLFVTGTVYGAVFTAECALTFVPSLMPMVQTVNPNFQLSPNTVMTLAPLAVAMLSSLILAALPPRIVRRAAPLLWAATLTTLIHAAVLVYPNVPAWVLLLVLLLLSFVAQVWAISAFRGVLTCATALTGAWCLVLGLDVVDNRGVVYEFLALYHGLPLPEDGSIRVAVWIQLTGAVAIGCMGWIAQLLRFQGDWLHDPFASVKVKSTRKLEDDVRFLMNA